MVRGRRSLTVSVCVRKLWHTLKSKEAVILGIRDRLPCQLNETNGNLSYHECITDSYCTCLYAMNGLNLSGVIEEIFSELNNA